MLTHLDKTSCVPVSFKKTNETIQQLHHECKETTELQKDKQKQIKNMAEIKKKTRLAPYIVRAALSESRNAKISKMSENDGSYRVLLLQLILRPKFELVCPDVRPSLLRSVVPSLAPADVRARHTFHTVC